MNAQRPIAVDDFGCEVYVCHATGRLVWASSARFVGAAMPGVKARYVVEASDDATVRLKASGIAFHESDANCNTCARLVRDPSERRAHAPLRGHCHLQSSLTFWPDDPMHMPCYESRWPAATHIHRSLS